MTAGRLVCVRCGMDGHVSASCRARLIQACMGGNCGQRDDCKHYNAAWNEEPSERLCLPGQDGVIEDAPIIIHKPAGSWERKGAAKHMAKAKPFDGLVTV